MTIGTSILLLVAGAILRFAVTVTAKGFNLHTIGVILMIAGAVGLALSLLWLAVWSDRRRAPDVVERPDEIIRRRDRY